MKREWNSQQPKNVLVVRLSAIGDCIATLPTVNAMKRAWPDSKITWVVDCAANKLLEGQPAIDEVIRLKKGWLGRPRELLSLVRTLRSKRFYLVIDPQGLLKSSLLGWLSGARKRVGFMPPVSRERAHWFYTDRVTPRSQHIVDRQLELLLPLGIDDRAAEFEMCFGSEVLRIAHSMVRELTGGRRFCVINPGAGWQSRIWAMDRYADVAKHLALTGILPLIAWGTQPESALADEIVSLSGQKAIKLPDTTLPCLAEILRGSEFYLGSDTGPMHMAVAVGAKCIVLHGPTEPAKSGAYGSGHIAIQRQVLTGSSRERRSADNSVMLAISTQDVTAACDQILNASKKAA